MEITLTANKALVMEEVAQTTSYTGAKMVGDADAYERISTVDDDRGQLERFWAEACSAFDEKMKRLLSAEYGERTWVLEVSSRFDPALTSSMQDALYSYLVKAVVGRWFALANKAEAADYLQTAAATLESIHRKAYYKRAPQRPTY